MYILFYIYEGQFADFYHNKFYNYFLFTLRPIINRCRFTVTCTRLKMVQSCHFKVEKIHAKQIQYIFRKFFCNISTNLWSNIPPLFIAELILKPGFYFFQNPASGLNLDSRIVTVCNQTNLDTGFNSYLLMPDKLRFKSVI